MITAMSTTPVEAARALAPHAAELAAEAERGRRLPAELSAELSAAGLYRLCVPASVGGLEAAPGVLLEVVETLAAADATPGWCVAVCATSGMLAAYLDQDSAAEVFGQADRVTGGVFAPSGRALAGDDDELSVTGRWRFASNCENCDWLMGGCIVFDGEQPRLLEGGRPDIRLVLMPAGEVEVIDTWSVSGLRATGSHDIAVDGLAVPLRRSGSLLTDRPRERGPLYAFPPFGLLAAAIAAVALGIARGALDDLIGMAGAKTPTLSTRKLAERAVTQTGVGRAEAGLEAARGMLYASVERAWEAARASDEIPVELRARVRMGATHAVETAAAAVDTAYSLAGGSAIYETSPLQRRFRDVHAATQHMLVAPATWELTGRSLLGLEFDSTQL
ncbi:MAG: indole-3-acetate monooxygenase [Solirubrobacterales bacterium]|jgi:alkylation response protein AidB-like acyl-CoA dehydrogenase|nr:indole-3-acetate monooxygenase [Solirubrobacterales bacterium]